MVVTGGSRSAVAYGRRVVLPTNGGCPSGRSPDNQRFDVEESRPVGLGEWHSNRFWRKQEKLRSWATQEAEKATVGSPATVKLRVASRDAKRVGALDNAMESHGYLFAEWTSPNQIVFREASEEIAFRKRLLFSDEGAVFADSDESPRGFQFLQFVAEGIAISPMRDVVFAARLIQSFSLWERRLGTGSPSAQWACVTVDAAIDGAPPPLHYLFPLYTEWETKHFREAMSQIGVAQLPERTHPEVVWHWTTSNPAAGDFA